MVPPSEDDEVDIMAEMDSIAPDDDGDEADSMAAEWEAMLGGDDDDDLGGMGAEPATRVLNQDEIDSLLDFDETRFSNIIAVRRPSYVYRPNGPPRQ